MSDWSKSAVYGGVYAKTQKTENCINCDIKYPCKYRKIATQLEKFRNFAINSWEKIGNYLPKL